MYQQKIGEMNSNILDENLKASHIKTWKALAVLVGKKPNGNLKRTIIQSIDRLNGWLKHVGLKVEIVEL